MVETALKSLHVYHETRNNKNFVRELLKSKTSEGKVLNVERLRQNLMEDLCIRRAESTWNQRCCLGTLKIGSSGV